MQRKGPEVEMQQELSGDSGEAREQAARWDLL